MSLRELLGRDGVSSSKSGLDWLKQFKKKYPHAIWLHPQEPPVGSSYWTQSFRLIGEQFDMYQVTVEGLTQGMRKLLANR